MTGKSGSLPARERGLKSFFKASLTWSAFVAPCAGAWIEIGAPKQNGLPARSLPARERGLKFVEINDGERAGKSLPARERGLKCEIGQWRI